MKLLYTLTFIAISHVTIAEEFTLSNGVTGNITYPTFETTNPIGFNGYLLDEGSPGNTDKWPESLVCFERNQAKDLLKAQASNKSPVPYEVRWRLNELEEQTAWDESHGENLWKVINAYINETN